MTPATRRVFCARNLPMLLSLDHPTTAYAVREEGLEGISAFHLCNTRHLAEILRSEMMLIGKRATIFPVDVAVTPHGKESAPA
jgi:hypothetical protein